MVKAFLVLKTLYRIELEPPRSVCRLIVQSATFIAMGAQAARCLALGVRVDSQKDLQLNLLGHPAGSNVRVTQG